MYRTYGRVDGDDGDPPAVPPWLQQPQDEMPVLLPVGELLARTDGSVLTVSRLEVYSTGVVIHTDSVIRRRGESGRDWSWIMHGGPGRRRDETGEELHWSVALADGSTTALGALFAAHRTWDERPEGWTLTFANGTGGGGGGEDRYEMRHGLWLWPLPPAGPFEIVAEWRERGIPESRVTLDGDAVLAAVPRVRPLWP